MVLIRINVGGARQGKIVSKTDRIGLDRMKWDRIVWDGKE